ncbi:MAG: hypothetical protein JWO33_1431 [Caulobacteraceae bacterium]|nr:hypothetical protein [Caulobacteraceae bacterium]
MTLFQHPVLAFRYVATFLGGPFGPAFLNDALYPFQAAGCLAIGAVGIVLTAITLTHIALRRGPASYLVALGAVILFAGASAAVTSAGRMDYFGVGQALSSRYATPAAIFWAALLLYWAGVSSQQASPRKALLLAWMIGAPLLFVPLWVGERQMKPVVMDWVAKVNLGADALLSNVYDPEALAGVTMKPSLMAGWAHFLAKRQLSIFRLDEAAWLNRPLDHVARLTSSRACAGRFETVHNGAELTGDQLRASGWAWDRRNAREATRIVLTAADLKVRGFATADFPRLELPRRHPAVRTARAGWQGFVRGRNGETLRAFAILPGKQACEIGVRRIHGVTRQAALGQLAPEQVGNILSANASGEGYFVPDDFPKTAGLAPGPAYGSYAANGAATGAILFGPSVARGREIAFAIVTGADAQKVKVQLVDPASDEVLAEVAPAPRTTWTWVSLPVEPGRPFKLVARDNNPEPGEWIGMTSPYEVRR